MKVRIEYIEGRARPWHTNTMLDTGRVIDSCEFASETEAQRWALSIYSQWDRDLVRSEGGTGNVDQ